MPFRKRFNTRVGRPTIPTATYLRMMYLKLGRSIRNGVWRKSSTGSNGSKGSGLEL